MKCPACGETSDTSDRYCPACGKALIGLERISPLAWTGSRDRLLARLRARLAPEFDVKRELGRGGQGAVYLAWQPSLQRNVAIKVVAPVSGGDDDALRRLLDEARTIAALRHPNIVTIYDIRQLDELPILIVRYLEGGSLADLLANGETPDFGRIRQVVTDVGGALLYAHGRGIVHRDVAPGNILFDEEGAAVVTDFGLAKLLSGPNQSRTGTVVGHPHYMSPEVCSGESATAASDQYALGVVTYEMITGRAPFDGSDLDIMRGHTEESPPAIRQQRPDCTPALERVVMRMMAKQPGDRWPSLAAAIDAIDAAFRPERARPPESTPTWEVEPPLLRSGRPLVRRRSWALLTTFMLATGAIAAIAIARNAREDAPMIDTTGPPPQPHVVGGVKAGSAGVGYRIRGIPAGFAAGDSASLVLVTDSGAVVPANVRWTTAEIGTASMDSASGRLTALAEGVATISAWDGDRLLATRRIRVLAADVVATLDISQLPVLTVGESRRVVVTARDAQGRPVVVAPEFSVGPARVATITPDGMLTAVGPGPATMTATVNDKQASIDIDVIDTPAPPRALEAPRFGGAEMSGEWEAFRGALLARDTARVRVWFTGRRDDPKLAELSRVLIGSNVELRACAFQGPEVQGSRATFQVFCRLHVRRVLNDRESRIGFAMEMVLTAGGWRLRGFELTDDSVL